MCLHYLKNRKEVLANMRTKDGFYTGYKVVKTRTYNGKTRYSSDCRNFSFHKGINIANSNSPLGSDTLLETDGLEKYGSGFHVWRTKKAANHWRSLEGISSEVIIKVKFRKEWIKTTGVQKGNDVLVLSQMEI